MPTLKRRAAFSTLWAMNVMNPSQSTPACAGEALPQSSQPRLRPFQPVQRCKCSLDNGPTPRHFPPVGGRLVPFLVLKVPEVIDGQSQVPAFPPWGKTLYFDGTSLAILLSGYVEVKLTLATCCPGNFTVCCWEPDRKRRSHAFTNRRCRNREPLENGN